MNCKYESNYNFTRTSGSESNNYDVLDHVAMKSEKTREVTIQVQYGLHLSFYFLYTTIYCLSFKKFLFMSV